MAKGTREFKPIEKERITKEQFDTDTAGIAKRGGNIDILKEVHDTQEPMKITCADEKHAKVKIVAFSVIRKKFNFQLKFVRDNNILYIAPGVYIPKAPSERKSSGKSNKKSTGATVASRAAMGQK